MFRKQNKIKTLYCQGHVYQKDKVLRLFNSGDIVNNEYRIILISEDFGCNIPLKKELDSAWIKYKDNILYHIVRYKYHEYVSNMCIFIYL